MDNAEDKIKQWAEDRKKSLEESHDAVVDQINKKIAETEVAMVSEKINRQPDVAGRYGNVPLLFAAAVLICGTLGLFLPAFFGNTKQAKEDVETQGEDHYVLGASISASNEIAISKPLIDISPYASLFSDEAGK